MTLKVINDHDLFPQLCDWQTMHRPSYLSLECMAGLDAALVFLERPQGLHLAPWEAVLSISRNQFGFYGEGLIQWRAGDWELWRASKRLPASGPCPWEWPRLNFGEGRGMSWRFSVYAVRELQPFLHTLYGLWNEVRNVAENYLASAAADEARYLQTFFKSQN